MVTATALLVPSTIAGEHADPRVCVHRIGMVGRAAAAFQVPEVVVVDLEGAPERRRHDRDGRWVARVLNYQATAPYLRRQLFPRGPELAHVGVLPPLELPRDTVGHAPKEGEVRMGIPAGAKVDIGTSTPARSRDPIRTEQGCIAVEVVRAARGGHTEVRPYEGPEYTGFRVERATAPSDAASAYRRVVAVQGGAPRLETIEKLDDCALAVGMAPKSARVFDPSLDGSQLRSPEAAWAGLAALANRT